VLFIDILSLCEGDFPFTISTACSDRASAEHFLGSAHAAAAVVGRPA
jgi:hypothetical protein